MLDKNYNRLTLDLLIRLACLAYEVATWRWHSLRWPEWYPAYGSAVDDIVLLLLLLLTVNRLYIITIIGQCLCGFRSFFFPFDVFRSIKHGKRRVDVRGWECIADTWTRDIIIIIIIISDSSGGVRLGVTAAAVATSASAMVGTLNDIFIPPCSAC